VKKLQDSIDISNSADSTVAAVIDALVQSYKEYAFEPKDLLRATVREVIDSLLHKPVAVVVKPASMSGPVSLNQGMINQYRNSASKRHRPTDEEDGSAVGAALENGANAVSAEETGGVQAKLVKTAAAGLRKKKAAPKLGEAMSLTQVEPAFMATHPTAKLADMAGIDSILQQIRELVFYPVQYPELYSLLGVSPPCGILLHGPSGCGKTLLATAIAGELGLPFFKASGPELVGGTSGESEERVRQMFESAAANAPSVLFIDGLDVIAGKKESSQRGMERRLVAQLFDSIDFISALGGKNTAAEREKEIMKEKAGLESNMNGTPAPSNDTKPADTDGVTPVHNPADESKETEQPGFKGVVLIAATNKAEALDPGVRGRFSKEVALPVPDAPARAHILRLMTKQMRLCQSVDFAVLGKATPGFVGSDLQALAREAGMLAVTRIVAARPVDAPTIPIAAGAVAGAVTAGALEVAAGAVDTNVGSDATKVEEGGAMEVVTPVPDRHFVEMGDFTLAAKSIQPTAKREGFAVAPNVTWADVGALAEVREELLHNVLEPIAHPERFLHLGLEVPAGVLFFGPPGCGKTLLAKALANQSGANFISVKGPELLSMYVGESESRVRQVFARARSSAPCVIFFDELDALCPKRGSGEGSGGNGNGVSDRVVNQLLTELDGLESRRDVYIIAATNRLELIDEAMLRPGRLGKLLHVPLPTAQDRVSILRALTKKVAICWHSEVTPEGVVLNDVATDERANGFSGADMAALVREAGLAVVREIVTAGPTHPDGDNGGHIVESGGSETGALTELSAIYARHFEMAFGRVRASVSSKDRTRYELVNTYIKDGCGAIQALQQAAAAMKSLK